MRIVIGVGLRRTIYRVYEVRTRNVQFTRPF